MPVLFCILVAVYQWQSSHLEADDVLLWEILSKDENLKSTNVQDDLWLYSCKAVLGRCPHSNRRQLDGAEAAGNCSAQPCPRQTLRNVPTPMLLAHLEKKKQHCLQEWSNCTQWGISSSQIGSLLVEGSIAKERRRDCGCLVLHFS